MRLTAETSRCPVSRGSRQGYQFKLLAELCFLQVPHPRAACCHCPHHQHLWVLLSQRETAPALQTPEAESQRFRGEIMLYTWMYPGHRTFSSIAHLGGEQLCCLQHAQKNKLAARKPSSHQWGAHHKDCLPRARLWVPAAHEAGDACVHLRLCRSDTSGLANRVSFACLRNLQPSFTCTA